MSNEHFDFHIHPSTDGFDHIRIHPSAETALGRLLCNAAHLPLIHPIYGEFACMEGYWQWLRTGMQHELFRTVMGHRAYSIGMRYTTLVIPDFRKRVLEGLDCKITQGTYGGGKRLSDLIVLSNIPFVQYALDLDYGDYIVDHNFQWFHEGLTQIRENHLSTLPDNKRFAFPTGQLLEETMLSFETSSMRSKTNQSTS